MQFSLLVGVMVLYLLSIRASADCVHEVAAQSKARKPETTQTFHRTRRGARRSQHGGDGIYPPKKSGGRRDNPTSAP